MQLEQKIHSDYEERILKMKEQIISQPHEICIERAVLFTESYKKTKGLPSIIRFAKALEHLLTNMTIKIWDDEFLVGNRCTKMVGTPLYPEVRIDTIEQDLDLYDKRETQRFLISDADKRTLREEIIPYWKIHEETVKSRFDSYLSPELKSRILDLVYIVDTNITNGNGHFFPGHENILKEGIGGLISKADKKMRMFWKDEKKKDFLQSIILVLSGVKKYIVRFAYLALEMANKQSNPFRQQELKNISEICFKISEKPPESFKEALQLILFTHIICGLEDGGFAISIGRLDQILYPFYVKDLKYERITSSEVQFLIENFYIKSCTLWNYVLNKGIIAGEGPPIAENLTIGGVNREGNDATNELTYILLDAYNRLKTVQPSFSIRIHDKAPMDLLTKVGKAIKSGTSIALFNDNLIIPGLVNRGYLLEDARDYAPIGCVEPAHPYKTHGNTNATQINGVKILELTLNNGTDMFSRKKYGLENNKKIESFDDLWNEFSSQLKFFIQKLVETMTLLEKSIAKLKPQLFLSATTDACIERGLDITKGGAIYDFMTTQFIGLATVADSLAVIKKIVFEDKLLTFEELTQLLFRNYKGTFREKSGSEWREFFINKVPKYGNDDTYVDSIAHNVAKLFCDELCKYKNFRGGIYNPGMYSTTFHLAFGVFTAASADGRKSREPLSNGVGPTNGRDRKGPTAVLNSIMKLRNELITNGTSLILSFHPKSFKAELFPSLIQTFFQPNGGFHLQFNVFGRETLYDAQKNPQNYPGLVIRIAGYPVLFNELSKGAQDEIIAKTEY